MPKFNCIKNTKGVYFLLTSTKCFAMSKVKLGIGQERTRYFVMSKLKLGIGHRNETSVAMSKASQKSGQSLDNYHILIKANIGFTKFKKYFKKSKKSACIIENFPL